MANAANPKTPTKPARAPRPQAKLAERMKSQLNQAALRSKVTIEELSDLEQHIKRLTAFLGAA